MGKSERSSRSRRRKSLESSSSSPSSSSSSSDSESPERRKKRHRSSRHRDSSKMHHSSSSRSSRKRKESRDEGKSRRRKRRHRSSSSDDDSEPEKENSEAKALARAILEKFPDIASDLEQLLQMVDDGQGVDVGGIPNRSLVKHLKKLFVSLKLKQNETGVFLLPPSGLRTLDVIRPILASHHGTRDNQIPTSGSPIRGQSLQPEANTDVARAAEENEKQDSPTPARRSLIGPEMPSRELLAAAAELTEAQTLLREADLEDNGLLIGPPPPALVAEAASANEAERFEEVARIADAEAEKPYDVLGVNWKMSADNIKKRYWKLSLMVHPDKCSHPLAQQAFVKLNQAFKDLQDSDKRKDIDDKIKLKEEQEAFKAELRALREAAQWRRLQGISMEGDEELLAVPQEAPKRDEWMTTLPPERKPGMTMHSTTSFSKTAKEGRGDTSAWTDNPLDKAQKAKQNYLEAYNRAKAIADTEDFKKSADADLVDKYNSSKRSISLVQKHQEESKRHMKKKSKQQQQQQQRQQQHSKKEEEWAGEHPWKPWDREKDLEAGRKKVNLDSTGMAQGLSSRFSSGDVQRNFL